MLHVVCVCVCARILFCVMRAQRRASIWLCDKLRVGAGAAYTTHITRVHENIYRYIYYIHICYNYVDTRIIVCNICGFDDLWCKVLLYRWKKHAPSEMCVCVCTCAFFLYFRSLTIAQPLVFALTNNLTHGGRTIFHAHKYIFNIGVWVSLGARTHPHLLHSHTRHEHDERMPDRFLRQARAHVATFGVILGLCASAVNMRWVNAHIHTRGARSQGEYRPVWQFFWVFYGRARPAGWGWVRVRAYLCQLCAHTRDGGPYGRMWLLVLVFVVLYVRNRPSSMRHVVEITIAITVFVSCTYLEAYFREMNNRFKDSYNL